MESNRQLLGSVSCGTHRRWGALTAVVVAVAFLMGCSGQEELVKPDESVSALGGSSKNMPRKRYDSLESKGFDVSSFDLNADGVDDQFHYSSGGTIARIERDLNFDHVIDCYEYYRDNEMLEEEYDLDLDSTVDVVRFYKAGKVSRKQYAVGFRADMTIARRYDDSGLLIQVQRDSDGNGTVDTWETYEPGAKKPSRIEVDTTGDGRPNQTIEGS
ncbi:MAG: hypothetical protein AUK47_07045 [Deltaproteobacteria bacterium CG2_30_63_29]|nr:MAG: hypothetical protein AUK47_07045 [Deltaproteobacteria bacterium CG2_30_63_29]PJB36700.1 MAG: hypothetical protein CO108_22775 [Deltaproteobacteria bacterium CG_4_9_14_3_um_filter_63_12]